jgi:hypothetical protein
VKRTKKNADWEVTELGLNREFLKLLAAARARFAAGRGISVDEMKRAVLPQRLLKRRSGRTTRKAR